MFTQKLLDDEIPTINGDGLHSRDYIYVSDVVDANIAAMTYGQNDYFNIAYFLCVKGLENKVCLNSFSTFVLYYLVLVS